MSSTSIQPVQMQQAATRGAVKQAGQLAGPPPTHSLILYTRPLHPELFQMKARRTLQVRGTGSHRRHTAEFEAWLTPLGHMLRYQTASHCFCELLTDRESGLPTSGVALNLPAVGEKDHEQLFAEACTLYTTSVQTENLTDTIYASTFREMIELSEEVSALLHTWEAPAAPGIKPGAKCLSMLELQRFDDELHAQSTHMFPKGGLVLRTQTVFQRV